MLNKNFILLIAVLFYAAMGVAQDTLQLNIKKQGNKVTAVLLHRQDTITAQSTLVLADSARLKINVDNQPYTIKFQLSQSPFTSTLLRVTKDTAVLIKSLKIDTSAFVMSPHFDILVQLPPNNNQVTAITGLLFGHQKNGTGSGKVGQPPGCPVQPFIDTAILASVQNSIGCGGLCDMRASLEQRSQRQFSTDYYVRFDASGKLDVYTICKHIFTHETINGKSQLIEKYRRISNKRFSPPVGSQVKFEVINLPLTEHPKIVVADSDLFINGSSAIEALLNNQIAATIGKISTPLDTAKKTSNEAKATSVSLCEPDSAKLDRLFAELQQYVKSFKLSACTVAANTTNLPVILQNIRTQFALSGTDIIGALKSRFTDTAKRQEIEAIKDMLDLLAGVRPVVYATSRLVNRDFVTLRLLNANQDEVARQVIRPSWGLKIDFSTGIFLTGLSDFSYIFKDSTFKQDSATGGGRDTSGRIIVREKNSTVNIGFGFLSHIYTRLSSDVNIGLAVGFMSTTHLDLRFLLGGSLKFQSLFGANIRIAFSGGVVWGNVVRLSNGAYEGLHMQNGKPVFYSTQISTPPTVTVRDHSWFFGVTYNFK